MFIVNVMLSEAYAVNNLGKILIKFIQITFIFFLLRKDDILKGVRPQFDATWAPPQKIQKMVKDCWEKEADKRPTARSLISMLPKIIDD